MTTHEESATPDAPMPLVEHLREFRSRLIYALIALTITTIICSPFAEQALEFLITPLDKKPLALDPTATIVQYIKVAVIGGISLAMPVILYQVVAFLLPALTRRERNLLFFFLPAATFFFIAGVVFAAVIAVPVSLNFLQSFGEGFAEIHYRLDAYTSFVTTMLLALGIGFQTPLIIFFMVKLGIVSYPFLIRNTRWAFLITAILAAVLTPTPDPLTMLVVMAPLFLLYLLGVLFARFA